jgi:hypothetical protein
MRVYRARPENLGDRTDLERGGGVEPGAGARAARDDPLALWSEDADDDSLSRAGAWRAAISLRISSSEGRRQSSPAFCAAANWTLLSGGSAIVPTCLALGWIAAQAVPDAYRRAESTEANKPAR